MMTVILLLLTAYFTIVVGWPIGIALPTFLVMIAVYVMFQPHDTIESKPLPKFKDKELD